MPVVVLALCPALSGPSISLPVFGERVSCGFPSPAESWVERRLDLSELCVKRPAATYFVRAQGESMIGAGIFPDDVLVVDRSLKPRHGHVVIASLDGELTVKRLELRPRPRLVPCSSDYSPVELDVECGLEITGVATYVVHDLLQEANGERINDWVGAQESVAERTLDLTALCVRRPASTYFARAQGDSMVDVGIFHDDILVVDRSITAGHGHVVIAALDGELTVKQLELSPRPRLIPRNEAYAVIELADDSELDIRGVVTFVIHSLQPV